MADIKDPLLQEKINNQDRINGVFKPEISNDIPPKAANSFTDGVAPESVGSGQSTQKLTMVDGYWQSSNYVTGVSGWRISPNGDVEFANGTFRGNVSTDVITDVTYGLNGAFVKTFEITDFTSPELDIDVVDNHGGLLTINANYIAGVGNTYRQLPGFNVATNTEYYGMQKSGGKYQIYHLGANIKTDIPTITAVHYTVLFNSLETSGAW